MRGEVIRSEARGLYVVQRSMAAAACGAGATGDDSRTGAGRGAAGLGASGLTGRCEGRAAAPLLLADLSGRAGPLPSVGFLGCGLGCGLGAGLAVLAGALAGLEGALAAGFGAGLAAVRLGFAAPFLFVRAAGGRLPAVRARAWAPALRLRSLALALALAF